MTSVYQGLLHKRKDPGYEVAATATLKMSRDSFYLSAREMILHDCRRFCQQGRQITEGDWRGGGMGGVTPPQRTNHLIWQGESSGLAGQSKILNYRM